MTPVTGLIERLCRPKCEIKSVSQTTTCCRRFEGELANAETFFFGRHRKHENLTMLSVYPFEFQHGVQVWPEKCTMQRPNGDDHVTNCHNMRMSHSQYETYVTKKY